MSHISARNVRLYQENTMIDNVSFKLKEWRDKLEEMRGYL
jgi:hypothetical protein